MAAKNNTAATPGGEPPRAPPRRTFLGHLIGAATGSSIVYGCTDLSAAGVSSAATPPHGGAAALPVGSAVESSFSDGSNPDAELIRLCADYMEAVDACNGSGSDLEPADDPLWHAVEAIELRLDGLPSRTIAGIIAKAQVAHHFAQQPDGHEDFSTPYTGDWPERVVRDLLALHGGVA